MRNPFIDFCRGYVHSPLLTFYTMVLRLEVGLEFHVTGLGALKLLVGDPDLTSMSPGALPVRNFKDIGGAANISKVTLHAASQPHASVVSHLHDDNLVRVTGSHERL